MGCAVIEERSWENRQSFVDALPPVIFYCTNGFTIYQDLSWPLKSEHLLSIKKERTYTIENIDVQLRTYLARQLWGRNISWTERVTKGYINLFLS